MELTNETIEHTICINAPAAMAWRYLTTPDLMKLWMLDTGIEMEIITDWKAGSPITMRGMLHGMEFENTGKILAFEPEKTLVYNHLSSISQLPDDPENFCNLAFHLTALEQQTQLNLTITNFPTAVIFKHLEFYWKGTLTILKKTLEHGPEQKTEQIKY